ncbi:MAG: CpaD family pilus assembly protein [Pseudomonadota bacterium]
MSIKTISPFLGITLILSLIMSGCSKPISNGAEQARPYEVRHPITLVKQEASMEVPISITTGKLTDAQKAKIKSFVYGYHDKGMDNLIISVPESGIKAAVARKATKEITETIKISGISEDHILVGTYKPRPGQSGNITIRFDTITAKGPDCSDSWSENLSDAANNTPWLGLGCSTRSNFAAMISNPNDLVEMRPMGPAQAARRVDAHDKYLLGQTTGASRSAEETAESTAQ